jgi:hypothetical protein
MEATATSTSKTLSQRSKKVASMHCVKCPHLASYTHQGLVHTYCSHPDAVEHVNGETYVEPVNVDAPTAPAFCPLRRE